MCEGVLLVLRMLLADLEFSEALCVALNENSGIRFFGRRLILLEVLVDQFVSIVRVEQQ
jgi:hypothetical protein